MGGILEFYLTDVVIGTGRNPQTRVAHPSPPHPPEGGIRVFVCSVVCFVARRNDLEGLLAPGMKEPVKGTQHFRGAPSGAGWMGTRLTESGPGELHHAGMDAEAALPPWPRVLRKSIHCTSVGRIRDTLGRVKA